MMRLLVILLLTGLCTALHGQSLRGIRFKPATSTITLSATLSSAPTSVTVLPADIKYNKLGIFSLELDDNSKGMRDVFAMWHGGKAQDSTSYPGMGHSDGCGNTVNFRGALAVNGHGGYLNNDQFTQPALTYSGTETINLVRSDWMVMNHGEYHNAKDRYGFGFDAGRNVRVLQSRVRTMALAQGLDYDIRTLVCPSAWTDFARAADSSLYLAATSAGQRDNYPLLPVSGQSLFNVSAISPGFQLFGRWLDDSWTTTSVQTLKTQWDNLVSSSTGGVNKKMWRLFSHGPQNAANFLDFSTYMVANGQDKIWVASLQEICEYLEVKRLTTVRYSLSGNVLTITLDQLGLPAVNHFRDMSLLLTGATIQAVSVSNAERVSYNASTGLINVFKRKPGSF